MNLYYLIGFAVIIGLAVVIARLFSRPQPSGSAMTAIESEQSMHVISRDEHNISRKNISQNALKVLYRLGDAGFDAYIVGGGVRDLLLGRSPKDFDVATNASPEEVHRLFRNSRLIGRRFKIVHVQFGREIIEVATFRAHHPQSEEENASDHSRQAESGMLLRDNVYGTLEEDVERRDFTINALYYTVKDFCIYDYHNGLNDLEQRRIRMIGNPQDRYREDPVRMLRAVRFAGKLDFELEEATAAPILELAPLLKDVSNARLFDEVLKLLSAGQGAPTWHLMCQYQLVEPILPMTYRSLSGDDETTAMQRRLVEHALANTDRRIAEEKPVTPAFLYAVLLWAPLLEELARLQEQERMPLIPALHEAAQRIMERQVRHIAIPRRISSIMKEIWELQFRLPRRQGKRAEQLLGHPRFRAAYDFLRLREIAGEDLDGLGQWWEDYQQLEGNDRREMNRETAAEEGGDTPRPRRRRPRNRKRKSADE
ncbi:polynucleotide adenylyltransferase PcnB [Pokkaliibacter sp. CJK22405]|uniref:polynucleotide adenylyltransferase PcnB n=1 Tax=Pokkaliibacter sp. CJK22405 TaxID=3384615 RepID=UPI00398484FA